MGGVQGIERDRRSFESRLDAIGWGLLFVVVGAVLLAPGLPEDAWLVAAGIVMIGTTVVRALLGMVVPWITPVFGMMALVGGAAGILGLESAGGPLVVIAVGLTVIVLGFYRPDRAASLASAETVRR
ncbi:MAG TPA: hypothetical protein VFW02_01985 [Candidatus Limnocylindrales bacterium]|nr:hypothetical protein [Candidatus Limnocylindrales bacterium]